MGKKLDRKQDHETGIHKDNGALAEKALKKRKQGKWRSRISSAMGLIVAALLFFTLMKPAITMETGSGSQDDLQLICGFEGHVHADACYGYDHEESEPMYAVSRVLECSFVPHVHDVSCFDMEGNLICGISEEYYHTHDEHCYDHDTLVCTLAEHPWNEEENTEEVWVLVCDRPESVGHTHSENCYTTTYFTDEEPICGLVEGDGHTHSEECYGHLLICNEEHEHTDACFAPELICGLEEGTGHIHTLECYPSMKELSCGMEESQGHVHTDECYAVQTVVREPHVHSAMCYDNGMLICGQTEIRSHQHTEECWQESQVLISGGHIHNSECAKVLICGLEEHVHTRECYRGTPEAIEAALGSQNGTDEDAFANGIEKSGVSNAEALSNSDSQDNPDDLVPDDGMTIGDEETEPGENQSAANSDPEVLNGSNTEILVTEADSQEEADDLVGEESEWAEETGQAGSAKEAENQNDEPAQDISHQDAVESDFGDGAGNAPVTDSASMDVENTASQEEGNAPGGVHEEETQHAELPDADREGNDAESTADSDNQFGRIAFVKDLVKVDEHKYTVTLKADEGVLYQDILELEEIDADEVRAESNIGFLEMEDGYFACRFAFERGTVTIHAGGIEIVIECTYGSEQDHDHAEKTGGSERDQDSDSDSENLDQGDDAKTDGQNESADQANDTDRDGTEESSGEDGLNEQSDLNDASGQDAAVENADEGRENGPDMQDDAEKTEPDDEAEVVAPENGAAQDTEDEKEAADGTGEAAPVDGSVDETDGENSQAGDSDTGADQNESKEEPGDVAASDGNAEDGALNESEGQADGEDGETAEESGEDIGNESDETSDTDEQDEAADNTASVIVLSGESIEGIKAFMLSEETDVYAEAVKAYLDKESAASEQMETEDEETVLEEETDTKDADNEDGPAPDFGRSMIWRVFAVDSEEAIDGIVNVNVPIHAALSDLVPDGNTLISMQYRLFRVHAESGEVIPVDMFEVSENKEFIQELAFSTDAPGVWVFIAAAEYAPEGEAADLESEEETLTEEELSEEVTVQLKLDFNAYAFGAVEESAVEYLNPGVAVNLSKLFGTAAVEQTEEVYTAAYEDILITSDLEAFGEIAFDGMWEVSSDETLSFDKGILTIAGDGRIELADGALLVVIQVVGYDENPEVLDTEKEPLSVGIAQITAGDGEGLPAGTDGHAVISDNESSVDRVKEFLNASQPRRMMKLMSAAPKAAPLAAGNETRYMVFDIEADADSENGFHVAVDLSGNEIIGSDFRLYHVHDDRVEPLEITVHGEILNGDSGIQRLAGFEFDTDSFSDFVLSYTVDFHYENGDGDETKSFDFNINGGDSVTLSELVEVLGILDGTKYENIEAFLDAVGDVRFSDDSLVSVTKDGNDWILTSLQSFTSSEELTITMNDGQVFTVLVTDPPGGPSNESSNLNDFLNKLTVSGASVVDGKYVVEEGKTYTVALTFKETPQHQFDNDGTLTYTFPEGVTIPSGTTKTINIAIVSGGKTYEIPATVTVNTDGTVTVKFDETDPNYFRLADSTNVGFRVTIDAQFTENVSKTEWGARAERDIVLDTTDTSDAYVTKSAVFDETTGTFTYTVKVTAIGAPENVNVKDIISGNALIFKNDVIVTGNSSSYTTNAVSNGFDYTFTSMQDGEEITITYTASVDPSKASNGTISADQTKNTATVQKEGGDPHTAEYSHAIDLTSISKSDGTAAGSTADGNKIYAWTIDYNPMAMVSVAGDTITDTIGSASQAYMSYYGNVTVKVYNASGTLVDTRTVTPGTSSWNYMIPSSDTAAYHYVFEYQTVVDQSAVNQTGNSLQLTNEVSGGGKTDGGTVNVGSAEKTTITKAVESSSSTEVTWVSNIHVPESGLNTAVVTDTLPYIYSGNIGLDGNYMLYDAYKDGTLEITGLLSGESYDVTTSDDKVVITFYKDSGKTQTGLQGTTGGHDITIRLTTSVNQDWLQYGYDNPSGWQASHKNEISINGTKAEASVTFAEPGISKSGSQETDGQGNTYFLYTIVLSGVSESPIIIEDTFDTSLLEVATERASLWNYFKIWGGNQYSQDDGITSVNYSDTANGILITANDVPLQSNGEYYPYYKIRYFLKLKDGVDLEDLAIENGGSYDLTNMASWGDHSASYTFTTTYDFLDKELLKEASVQDRQVQYRITYNPAKAELNGGEDLVMTDTLNANLSVDYSSVSISTDPEGVEVPYTLSGNDAGETIAKYTIPDSTKVVITYNAMVVGNGSVNYKNVVEANGVTETVDRTTNINIEGEGDGATADLSVVKLDGYDANKKLSGVQFKLYSADLTESGEQYDLSLDHSGVYEKTLITDENGVLKIDGTQIYIYFGVKYYLEEVAAPEGYQNISFKYQFTLTDDMDHVDYAHYVYFYSDSFQIKNWPLEGLVVGKSVESDDESDHTKEFTFEVSILTESGDVDTSVNETYGDMTFVSGVATIKLKDTEQASAWNMPSGTKFKVEEKDAEGYTVSTTVGDTTTEGSSYTGETGVDYTLVTFTNKKEDQTGSLKLTKVVHVDDQTPATDAEKTLVNGDYVFTVSSDNSIIKYVQITVTDGAPASYKIADTQAALESATSQTGTSALISGLAEGDYVITEIEKNGMTLKEAVRGDGDTDAVSSEKAVTVHVTAGQNEPADTSAAAAAFTNNIETVTAKVVKVWNHSGNTGTTPTSLTVTLSNGETKELNEGNNWRAEVTDLPKYDRTTGNLIEYSWTEAELPAGYYLSNIQETTDMATGVITTTLTNSYTDHYNPTTTITGKKVWDDGGEGRPASITVNLYKDGGSTPYRTITVQAPTGESANPDEWPFEFTNLPVFNSDGSVVQYTVEEVLPSGYTDEYGIKIEFSQATYVAGTSSYTIVNPYMEDQEIATGTDLGFVVIRHGNDFVVWTPRPLQDGELETIKTTVKNASDQFNKIVDPSRTITCVSGLPKTVDVGNKHAVSVYMKNNGVWVKFLAPNAQSDLVYGKIPYTYTQAGGEGGGTITNTKKNTDIEFGKQWIDISQQEIEWDQDIQVTVSRNKGDGTKDAAFSLVYNIAKTSVNGATGGTAEFSTGTEKDPKLKLTITTESGTKKYSFKIENLAYSSETDGKYTYYVEETNSQLTGYLAPSYTNTSAPTGATAAYDGGTIINKQEGGYELPSTGGPGTRLFTILGSILIAGAGVLLWRRRRLI